MSCCTLEGFNLLRALMAKGGGIWGQVCLEGGGSWRLPQPGCSTSGVSRVLTNENLTLLPAHGRRGPITSPPGLLWQKSQVVRRGSGSALAHSAQAQEPPSHKAL